MAKRLTNTLEETPTKGFGLKFCSDRNCNSDEDCCNCYAFNQTINKLRQLEDIFEKYGIESVEELDKLTDGMKSTISVLLDRNKNTKQDRDTWKRACELACEEIDCEYMYGINKENYSQYFYQQAKKEGENK